jgi:hypothetical protein
VGVRAVYRWLERGGRAAEAQDMGEECAVEDVEYAQLYRDVERAMADREEELLAMIDGEDKAGQWMRQAWKLERRDPENWGPPATRVVHEGAIEHKVTQELPGETQKALFAVFNAMAKPKELESGSS